MGFFSNLFKSKEQKLAEEQATARQEWTSALTRNDQYAMEQAVLALAIARLHEETVSAYQILIDRFPDKAVNYENELGIQYWGQGNYGEAMKHYIRSYNLDEGGGCAETNILELCQSLAEEASSPKESVQHMLRYFRVCTKAVDPTATFEEMDLMSIFRQRPQSLAVRRLAEAENGFDMLEEFLEEVGDAAFVAQTQQEMQNIQHYFGIERL